jgi:hypothetical protein
MEDMNMHSATKIARKGKNVTIQHDGKSHDFRYKKGWSQLLELLRNPEKVYPFKSFVTSNSQQETMNHVFGDLLASSNEGPGISILGANDADLFCDPRTLREVKERLVVLIQHEAELRISNDYSALDELIEEKEMLIQYLKEVLTPRGNIRVNNSETLTLKKTVGRRLIRVIEEIGTVFPDLASILNRQIVRGTYFQYIPSDHEIIVL